MDSYIAELKDFGLSENESKIYLLLLKHISLNPSEISKKTGLHRSYLYDALERMLDKGLINEIIVEGKKHFKANNPNVLKEHLSMKLNRLNSILPDLSKFYDELVEDPSVEVHKGNRIYKTLIKDVIANAVENSELYLIGVNEEFLLNIEPIYLKQYFKIIEQKNIKEKIIIPKGHKKIEGNNLFYKEIDPRHLGESFIILYLNKVYIFLPTETFYLIVIKSKIFYESYLKMFNLLWDL
jgi:sugar-specific transcriptional regulator TrmB